MPQPAESQGPVLPCTPLRNLGQMPLGLFPKRLVFMETVVGLIEIVMASLAGAWLYKE